MLNKTDGEDAMNAIVEIGGKQHNITEGTVFKVDHIGKEKGETLVIDSVMALVEGGKTIFGKPYLDGARVETKVVDHGRDRKVTVFKYIPKKRRRVKRGHRQDYTLLRVEKIIMSDNIYV
ncbi:MAG: 50S ribosomal protein L21 [bacterium]